MLPLTSALTYLLLALATATIAAILYRLFRLPDDGADHGGAGSGRRLLVDCEHMLRLAHALQQHRGMSAAWLAGDSAFDAPMRSKRRDVAHAIDALAPFAASGQADDDPGFSRYELSLLATQWSELCAELDGVGERPDADENITRHSLLVSHVLDWLATTGERRIAPHLDVAAAGLVRTWLVTLPMLGEQLGQARALGSGAAARGRCSPAERMRLMFLASRAESLMHQAIAESPRLPGALPATERVVRLIGVLRGDMLGTSAVLSAEAWFAEATEAIDAVYAWMTSCEDALRAALAERRPSG